MILGDTKPIGVAYRDQDLDGSTLTSPQLVLTALPAGTNPARPAIPSVIVTVAQVA